ncbi:LolA family protein [Ekhidna sp.]|uniref:LolA family protein n=1 Tax=Ekhidna sp. TaxID=2608089 RepID=UPI003CCBD20F
MKATICLLILALSGFNQGPFKLAKFEMEKRTNKDGKTMKMTADIYFSSAGNMVSHFLSPAEVYIINNEEGELKIYNPEANQVFQSTNYQAGSQNTNFYYFLKNQTADMGLKRVGFELDGIKTEGNMLINYWKPPEKVDGFDHIELVREFRRPIFMGYRDRKGNYMKKVYYYNYENIGYGIEFPMAITEIDYFEGDSIVSKTTFQNFRFDDESDFEMLNFKIPEDAELVK